MSEQLTHNQTQFSHKKFPITIISDHLYFQENIGSLFRIAEAFGVEKIILLGKNIPFTDRKINKTSRSTHRIVPFELIEDTQTVCDIITTSNAQVIALEITNDSIPITSLKLNQQPVFLIIGSEINGIQQQLLNVANKKVHIEMFGKNSSMNVIQATAIMLFQITNLIK